jgi:AraC family transcriptional regulator
LGQTLRFLYGTWLPMSGEEPRDFPLFMQRVTFFPDVAEHQAITDVYLPLK